MTKFKHYPTKCQLGFSSTLEDGTNPVGFCLLLIWEKGLRIVPPTGQLVVVPQMQTQVAAAEPPVSVHVDGDCFLWLRVFQGLWTKGLKRRFA